jgi:hypothetical protein
MYKKSKEIIKEEHNILNKTAMGRSNKIAIKNVKELMTEDPHIIRIDGIHAKDSDNMIMGQKI